MARWGRCDYEQLIRMNERLEQLSAAGIDQFFHQAAQELAKMLLNTVKKRTPVGHIPKFDGPKTIKVKGKYNKRSRTFLSKEAAIKQIYWRGYRGGTLRDGWKILPIEHIGGGYRITLVNENDYASYVEYGHRQTPGRFVPALGKCLKAGWVKGRFMMTISKEEVEALAPGLLEDLLYKVMREGFNAE